MRLPRAFAASLATLLTLTLTITHSASASSSARDPLQRVGLVQNADILTSNHRITAFSSFDLAFDLSTTGQRVRLSLEPNHDLFVQGAKFTYVGADGEVHSEEPVERLLHKVYKGLAWIRSGSGWDRVGWARVDVRRDGLGPLFEGTFTLNHDHHHVMLAETYMQTMVQGDPEVEGGDEEQMVVFRDSDIGKPVGADEQSELKRRSGEDNACVSDKLEFNTQENHPVYAAMRARSEEESFFSAPLDSLLGKRQLDGTPGGGGNSAGINLVSSIGSTVGCPSTRRVALVGVATDCTYIKAFGSDRNRTRENVIRQMNSASELFESTFNISLGLANVLITDPQCPTTEQTATPWNQDCSPNVDIQRRLNLFSSWRGGQRDGFSHWTLLSTCPTGSAIGLAWLGQACVPGSQPNGDQNETVAGANVVMRTSTEWQVIAHETGHTFGAVHDCVADTCGNANVVGAQQCCPLSSTTCDAGEQFIMNPSTAQGITRFSACSIGNVCSALNRNSVRSNCLSNNRNVNLTTTQTCGNGIVEGNEQCDCGGGACGDNACCDGRTCRFKNNAVCDDSNEDCCRNCQFASASTVCRASIGQCDPEERCTGNLAYCPPDKTRDDGSDCGKGLRCASGQCTSRNEQCRTVMGYVQGNNTNACDDDNCMLSCASPGFNNGRCFGMRQNFLDGTDCGAGGKCQNGRCNGSSVGNEIKSWIDQHRTLVIGLAAGIGGLLVFSILLCCVRSYRRRRRMAKYAPPAPSQAPPASYYGRGNGQPHRGHRSGRRGPTSSSGSAGVLMNQAQGPPVWTPQTRHAPPMGDVPQPPPGIYRTGSMRYA